MKIKIIFAWAVVLLLGNLGMNQGHAQPSESESAAAISGYNRLAGRLSGVLAQVGPPGQIQEALESALRGGLVQEKGDGNLPAIRVATVRIVLTNLFLLEKGIRQTSVATNTSVSPPMTAAPSGAAIADIRDPKEREEMVAYQGAVKPLMQLWNLHQALLAEYRRHWEKAVDAVAEPYGLSAERGVELKGLLLPYKGSQFAAKLGERLDFK